MRLSALARYKVPEVGTQRLDLAQSRVHTVQHQVILVARDHINVL